MLLGQRLELSDERPLATQGELSVDTRLDRREAQLLEPVDVQPRERLQLEIRERSPLPECLGRPEGDGSRCRIPRTKRLVPFHDEPLERLEVELARLDSKQVARRPRDETRLVDDGGAEHLAKARDVVAQRVVGRVDALIGKLLSDEPVA